MALSVWYYWSAYIDFLHEYCVGVYEPIYFPSYIEYVDSESYKFELS